MCKGKVVKGPYLLRGVKNALAPCSLFYSIAHIDISVSINCSFLLTR